MSDGYDAVDSRILVQVRQEAEGWVLLSPAVGLWSGHPHSGAVVGPGSSLGRLTTLNRRVELLLPDGTAGRVEGLPKDHVVALEFGAVLGRLIPLGEGDQQALQREAIDRSDSSGGDLEEGCRAVVAPTDGVFYRRPHPDAPPFVEVGTRLTTGQPVGLVEVMKTFNQILYGGPGLPDEVEVVALRCDDGSEIQAGQVLVVVR
jgi:biotin carboxyl carrier protein